MTNDKATPSDKTSFSDGLTRDLRNAGHTLRNGWASAGVGWRNQVRRWQRARLDYVVVPVGGSLPERRGPKPSFWARFLPLPGEPVSLELLDQRLRIIAEADNVRGVVIVMRELNAGTASLQSLRQMLLRLRAAGKEVVVYTPHLDLANYYVATAADRIVAPPGARFEVLGLYAEVLFLKDALARVGLRADVIQVSPYKTAGDQLSQSEMSPAYREQLDWLLDEQYDILTSEIADGRGLDPEALRALIDRAPFTVEDAREHGLIDLVAYDDELPALLAPSRPGQPVTGDEAQGPPPDATQSEAAGAPARPRLATWDAARRMMLEKHHPRTSRFIGVISVEGLIAMGPSRQPPLELPVPFLGGLTAGEQTLVGLLRRAEKLDDMAALILHIDSAGGSALASDLIARQLQQFAARKPLVVYMGNVAASGGYYIAAGAGHIVSQPLSVTGSIGVILARLDAEGLYDLLSVNRTVLTRGEHAGLMRDSGHMSDGQRAILRQSVMDTYERFKLVVSEGRGLPIETVDEIGGGKVWTGSQALKHGLVDNQGSFCDAVLQAARMANLDTSDLAGVRTVNLFARSSTYTLPAMAPDKSTEVLARLLGGEELRHWLDQPLLLAPLELRLR